MLLCGNILPSGSAYGNDTAAASDRTPRIPPHPITNTLRGFGFSTSTFLAQRRTAYATYVSPYTQAIRTAIITPLKPTPYSSSTTRLIPLIWPITYGSCRPINTNTIPFRTNVSASHTAVV